MFIPGWLIPTFITVITFGWALFYVDDGGGYFSGVGNVFALIPASIISMISWIIYAILK